MWIPIIFIFIASAVFLSAALKPKWQKELNLVALGLFVVTLAVIFKRFF